MPAWITSLLRLLVTLPWRSRRSRITRSGKRSASRAAIARPTTPAPTIVTLVSATRLGRGRVQDHQLLPDLARQARGQVLDLVDRRQRAVVVEVLDVQRRDLAGDREHLAAVIEVARQLEARHLARRQHARFLALAL